MVIDLQNHKIAEEHTLELLIPVRQTYKVLHSNYDIVVIYVNYDIVVVENTRNF